MRQSGQKLKQERFRLDIRRAVQQWSRLPAEVAPSLLLEVFETQLEKVLSNLV